MPLALRRTKFRLQINGQKKKLLHLKVYEKWQRVANLKALEVNIRAHS
jgi:hypothetical protein